MKFSSISDYSLLFSSSCFQHKHTYTLHTLSLPLSLHSIFCSANSSSFIPPQHLHLELPTSTWTLPWHHMHPYYDVDQRSPPSPSVCSVPTPNEQRRRHRRIEQLDAKTEQFPVYEIQRPRWIPKWLLQQTRVDIYVVRWDEIRRYVYEEK